MNWVWYVSSVFVLIFLFLFVVCSPTEFQCDSGTCILNDHKCDGMDDCKDGSDEKAALCRVKGQSLCPPLASCVSLDTDVNANNKYVKLQNKMKQNVVEARL